MKEILWAIRLLLLAKRDSSIEQQLESLTDPTFLDRALLGERTIQ